MSTDQLISNILQDIEVELSDEFDSNFEQGSFFGKTWPQKRSGEPSHLIKSGKLRRSLRSVITKNSVKWTSSEVYAAIHNEGGIQYVKPHHRRGANNKRYQVKGYSYKAKKRQFIGDHARVHRAVERCIDENVTAYLNQLIK